MNYKLFYHILKKKKILKKRLAEKIIGEIKKLS
jgi:hypothetical protein